MNMKPALFLFAALVSLPLLARDKTDLIVLTNGDRLTCEIKKLESGVLYAKLDYVDGSISISWSKVARIESKQLFLVQTVNGRTYTGTLNTVKGAGDQPLRIEVADALHGDKAVVEQPEIVNLEQYGDSFWRNFHGNLSAGYIYAKANDTTQYNLSSDFTYRRERTTVQLNFNSALSDSPNAVTTRNQVDLNAKRLLRWDNWFYEGAGSYLQNSAQGIDAQVFLGGGFGRYLKNTNTARISLIGGIGVQDTQYEEKPSEHDVLAMIACEMYLFRFKKSDLTLTAVALPNLSNSGRVRYNVNAQ